MAAVSQNIRWFGMPPNVSHTVAATVPPGRTTRHISPTARSVSGMKCRTRSDIARSKHASSNGNAQASARSKLIRGSLLWARAAAR